MKTSTGLLLLSSLCFPAASAAWAQTSNRPEITGIAFLQVNASDPAASDKFYRSLGYVPEHVGTTERFAVNDRQWIEVVPHAAPAPDTAAARMTVVGFMTTDAAGLEHYLKTHGQAIAQPLRDGRFAVRDPEGNRIVFVQAGTFHETPEQSAQAAKAPSHRIIHAGFEVRDRAAEDRFYKTLLGFKPYWYGGMTDAKIDFISQQVADGRDWLEYMLQAPGVDATPRQMQDQFGVSNHFSLGVTQMAEVVTALAADGCQGPNCSKTQMGRDGKVQLNVFDPDGTRVEYMEFKPSGPICCSEFTGPHPAPAQ